MSAELTIAIAGCCGRMGLMLVKTVQETAGVRLVAGSERAGFNAGDVQAKTGCKDLFVTADAEQLAEKADAIIDFTSPESTLAVAKAAAKHKRIHIIGTTGFSEAQDKELAGYAKDARIVKSGNFSIGVNLLQQLVEQAARALDDSYDAEIFEMHHQHKKDSPSGTALMLGEAAAKGRGVSLADKKVIDRNGERTRGTIGFSVARGGDVVGLHEVLFAGPGELITLKHQGFDRAIYAHGAIRAALWARGAKPGLYSMKDVLGLA